MPTQPRGAINVSYLQKVSEYIDVYTKNLLPFQYTQAQPLS